MSEDEDRLITVKQTSQMLGCCVRTVWEILSAGQLRKIHPPHSPRSTRVLLSDVRTYIRQMAADAVR